VAFWNRHKKARNLYAELRGQAFSVDAAKVAAGHGVIAAYRQVAPAP
jgi:hypothetical protein